MSIANGKSHQKKQKKTCIRDGEARDWEWQCGLCNEWEQRGCMAKFYKEHTWSVEEKLRVPYDKSTDGIGLPKGETPELTIARNNRVGTTREVFDHGSTTHVDCDTSAKET